MNWYDITGWAVIAALCVLAAVAYWRSRISWERWVEDLWSYEFERERQWNREQDRCEEVEE